MQIELTCHFQPYVLSSKLGENTHQCSNRQLRRQLSFRGLDANAFISIQASLSNSSRTCGQASCFEDTKLQPEQPY
jgi:hypothetical protein